MKYLIIIVGMIALGVYGLHDVYQSESLLYRIYGTVLVVIGIPFGIFVGCGTVHDMDLIRQAQANANKAPIKLEEESSWMTADKSVEEWLEEQPEERKKRLKAELKISQ